MSLTITFDDIIYRLQRSGGASVYWQEMTSRIQRLTPPDTVRHISGHRYSRMLPVYAGSRIFHSSHFRFAWNPKAKNVSTVYDMTYELGMIQGKGALPNIIERRISYFTADALICISENTKKDLLAIYPTLANRCPIHVVHLGCSLGNTQLSTEATLPQLPAVIPRYVLYVGGRGGYKNFGAALSGFQLSGLQHDGVHLLCTGAPFNPAEQEQIRALGLEGLVHVVGNVTSGQMIALYRSALCMVYPSKYEGFGLPPIEAMYFGCPVIAANSSSIPEVVGDAAISVQPDDLQAIAQAMQHMQDDPTRQALVDKGYQRATQFSWDISAQKHLEIYQSLL